MIYSSVKKLVKENETQRKQKKVIKIKAKIRGFIPWWFSGKVSTCQCRRYGLDPWSEKIPHASEHLSPSTTTIEPVCCSSWNLPSLEPKQEKPHQLKSDPHSPQLEKSPSSTEAPAQPELNLKRFFFFLKSKNEIEKQRKSLKPKALWRTWSYLGFQKPLNNNCSYDPKASIFGR